MTLLFTDIESSTRLLESLGDAYPQVLERHRAILSAHAEQQGGLRFGVEGDACFFSFDSPVAAIIASVESQRALAAECWPEGATVPVRMALHSGEVAELGDDRIGLALHHVARILGVAHGGQIVVSRAVVELVTALPPGIGFTDLGLHRLRNVVQPMHLQQVTGAGLRASFPPLRSAMSGATTLAAHATSFVGRDRELNEVTDLVAKHRLVTLTGPGGSGKTRLALEVARRVADRHAHGVWLVHLAGLDRETLVPEATLGALGLRDLDTAIPATDRLIRHLADRDVFLVLDNCEHVVHGAAALVAALLPACPAVHILATSREPLRVPGETECPVPPLDRPDAAIEDPEIAAGYDAVRLLVERARDVRPGFGLTKANTPAVTTICRRVDGLPLALELAAARLRVLSPEQVAARLGDQLGLLTEGGRMRPGRQQTLRATLDWSYDLLTSEEQTLFERLSVFAGGFTLAAAEVVAGDGVGVLDALERLVSKSLVAFDHERAEPRFRLLEAIRQYAAERLRKAGAHDEMLRRHRDWVVGFAEAAGRGFMGATTPAALRTWSARLRDEQDNVRQALEVSFARGETEPALRITAALGNPSLPMGQVGWSTWLARAVESSADAPAGLRARVLLVAGISAVASLNYDRAVPYLQESRAHFRRLGNRRREGYALLWLGQVAWADDVESRISTSWLEEALALFHEVNDVVGVGWTHALLATEGVADGDFDRAASSATVALEVGRASGLLSLVAESWRTLGVVAANRGDHTESERLLGDAAAAYRDVGDRWQLALVLGTIVTEPRGHDQYVSALARLREALRLSRELANEERMRWALQGALVVLGRRRAQEAAMLWGAWEAALHVHPRWQYVRRSLAPLKAELARADLNERRIAGRSLALERAVDLALRVVEEELAVGTKIGAQESTASQTPSENAADATACVFHREGDYWSIAYAGAFCRVKDTRGLHYLDHLLRHPGQEFHALDLTTTVAVTRENVQVHGDAGPALDAQAKAAYRKRLTDLRDELDEAERFNDSGRTARAREEIDALTEQLVTSVGLGGRDRVAGVAAERARSAVTHGIRSALKKIGDAIPGLADQLTPRIKTGVFCVYLPDAVHPVTLTF